MFEVIEEFLGSSPYYPCLFFVHTEIRRLSAAVSQLQQSYQWPILSIGNAITPELMAVPPQQRPRVTPGRVREQVQQRQPGPLLCTDIDLLFEPGLKLDPLRLFLETSRQCQTTLLIAWPGTFSHDVLAYATPEHHHYQTWRQPECDTIVQLS